MDTRYCKTKSRHQTRDIGHLRLKPWEVRHEREPLFYFLLSFPVSWEVFLLLRQRISSLGFKQLSWVNHLVTWVKCVRALQRWKRERKKEGEKEKGKKERNKVRERVKEKTKRFFHSLLPFSLFFCYLNERKIIIFCLRPF